ncbi:unnamed protein product, partial [Brenthis ino]
MTLMEVSDNIIAVANGSYVDYYDYTSHKMLQLKLNAPAQDDDFVIDIVISHDNKLLAVLFSSSKRLLIYEIPELNIVQSFTLPRSASKIRFGVNNNQIFVADKTGDVLIYDIFKEDKGTKLLGHLSLLLNVLQTNDGQYIITCDRDEKIKVSCYPNTYTIQTYCMGHKEFVNNIELVPHTTGILISTSGDGTVKVWNYTNGKLLYTIDTYSDIKNNEELKQEFSKFMDAECVEINSLPIVDCTIVQFDECSSLISVTVHSYNKVLIYYLKSINEEFSHNLVSELPLERFPAAIKFHMSSLFVYDKVDLKVLEYNISFKNECFSIHLAKQIKVFENEDINMETKSDHNAIKVLFKRKFDNVQEYQERKKLRLENN